jgi:hypothetical protein
MAKHQKTIEIIEAARELLREEHPMTVRQVYYQLVSRLVIENNRSQYQAVSIALVDARKTGFIPWNWIEDRLRLPRTVGMWNDLADFSETVKRAYRRNVWATQPAYLEVWEEKDALSGIFEDILGPYGITLNIGRGYDGWASIRNAAERYGDQSVTVLYFGDFDPSGEDMVRSLIERLSFFGIRPEVIKCALTLEDINRYNLPPALAKTTDTRRDKFVEKNGDICVELDALPMQVLRDRIRNEVEKRMDMPAIKAIWAKEKSEIEKLNQFMQQLEA